MWWTSAVATSGQADWTPVVATGVGALSGLVGVLIGTRSSRRVVHRQWIREHRLSSSVDLVDRVDDVSRILKEIELAHAAHASVHARLEALKAQSAQLLEQTAGAQGLGSDGTSPDISRLLDEAERQRSDLATVQTDMETAHVEIGNLFADLGEATLCWERALTRCLLVFDDQATKAMSFVVERASQLTRTTTGHPLGDPVDEQALTTITRTRTELGIERTKLLQLLRTDLLRK